MVQKSENLGDGIPRNSIRKRWKRSIKKSCSVDTLKKRVPVLNWLPNYSLDFLIQDLIAGITVGLTAIPQGIAYAVIAGLPVEYGLYSSLTSGFMYLIFGSCKDVTVGPTAVIATMTAKYASYSTDFAVLAAFLSGCLILLMGILKLGFLVNFISSPVIRGFTTAAALQIAASQLKTFFALQGGSGNIFAESIYNFFKNIKSAKLWDPILATATIILLVLLKMFGDGCKRTDGIVKKVRWFISLARNAVVVIFGMVLAYFIKAAMDDEPFQLVGEIRSGLPTFKLPSMSTVVGNETYNFTEMLQSLGPEFVTLPLVAILESVAIAKAFSEGGRVDATQEMIALGICNLVGSFGQSMPITGSFSRTALNYASGVKTTAGGGAKCLLIIMCLSYLTTMFYYIPKASLAGIIMVAMYTMIDKDIFIRLWRKSRLEFVILVSTMFVSLLWGLEYGIVTGILLDSILIVYRASVPRLEIEQITTENGDIITLSLCENLSYCSSEHIRKVILETTTEYTDLNTIVVLDGENLKNMDTTVASNLMVIVKDLEKQNRIILFLNFKSKLKDLCLDICPNADNMFVSSSKPIDLIISTLPRHM